jgi:hypothetical protein
MDDRERGTEHDDRPADGVPAGAAAERIGDRGEDQQHGEQQRNGLAGP